MATVNEILKVLEFYKLRHGNADVFLEVECDNGIEDDTIPLSTLTAVSFPGGHIILHADCEKYKTMKDGKRRIEAEHNRKTEKFIKTNVCEHAWGSDSGSASFGQTCSICGDRRG